MNEKFYFCLKVFMEDLKIVGKFQIDSKHFRTPDEFNLYYVKHKDEMANMTTQKLNKSFVIDGFRLTRIKGEICLKPVHISIDEPTFPTIDDVEHLRERIRDAQLRIEALEAKNKVLTDTINQIIKSIQGEA